MLLCRVHSHVVEEGAESQGAQVSPGYTTPPIEHQVHIAMPSGERRERLEKAFQLLRDCGQELTKTQEDMIFDSMGVGRKI